jgi:tRNA pseudouridine32 synthase/23S rRNA pseudouridine746 synthase
MTDTIRTLYHDAHLLVVDKPAGLPAVPGRGADKQDCLLSRLQAKLPAVLVVHRLDWATSGVIVFALNAESQRALSGRFERREVEKLYTAVVCGRPSGDAGTINFPMRKDFDRPPRHCIDVVHGRSARTDWQVVTRLADRTRLMLRPHTGRSHQLRLHMAAIGHPILGDTLYADPATQALSPRLLLHAESLMLQHPADGRRLTFKAECPF